MKEQAYNPSSSCLHCYSSPCTSPGAKKEYHEEYNVTIGTTLDLNNRYGNIIVETSETDQVAVDVKVTPNAKQRKRERLSA